MARGHVGDGGAIGDDVAREMPVSPEPLLQQHVACTGRGSIYRVVSAHNTASLGVDDEFPEGWQIGVFKIVWREDGVERVAFGLRAAVNGKMFGRGDGFEVIRVGA